MKFWKPSAERDAFSVPRSVQKSIPIKRVYKDGIFEVSGKFSKTWRFFDVNYKVASPEKQEDLFKAYCAFLNALPVNATAKITLFNRRLNQREFNANLFMPSRATGWISTVGSTTTCWQTRPETATISFRKSISQSLPRPETTKKQRAFSTVWEPT